MKKILLILVFSFTFSIEIYKEIKIENIPNSTIPFLASIGIDLDHIYKKDVDSPVKDQTLMFAV